MPRNIGVPAPDGDEDEGAESMEELDAQTGLPRYLTFAPSVLAMSSGNAIREELEKATRKTRTSNALHAKQIQEDTNLPLFGAIMAHIQNVAVDLVAHNYKITEWIQDQLASRGGSSLDDETLGLVEDLVTGARDQRDQVYEETNAALSKMLADVTSGKPVDLTDLKVLQVGFNARMDHLAQDLDNALSYLELAGDEDDDEEAEDDAEEEATEEEDPNDDGDNSDALA